MWALHRVSLATHDLDAACSFFETQIGLGTPSSRDDNAICFGRGSRGLRVERPRSTLTCQAGQVNGYIKAHHLALDVPDLSAVAHRLAQHGYSYCEASQEDFEGAALHTFDPAHNLVAFCQAATSLSEDNIQPWEQEWGWGLHHVNLQAGDVRTVVNFFCTIVGCREGHWQAPSQKGDFSIDPEALSILPLGALNRGLHIIRPDAGFAHRNNFAHNPSIGGHPAFWVKDVSAVKERLQQDDVIVTDAGMYAMANMHQIYVLDPSANMIEVNQFL